MNKETVNPATTPRARPSLPGAANRAAIPNTAGLTIAAINAATTRSAISTA